MIANVEHYLRETNRRFSEEHISVDQDWIQGCIEYFLSENPQISNENLFKSALEQWLLSDLAESGLKCLPESVLNNKNESVLNGKYVVQMQYLIDIAESAYEQWRKLNNKQLDEAEEEPEQRRQNISKKKRMLKLELTDGHSTAIAMECSPITCLNTKLLPGTKILMKGPLRCVNKVLFLEPKNVKILGGEVEKLSIENAYENVLLKALNRPITLTPKLEYQETNVVEQNTPKPNLPLIPVPTSHSLPTPKNIIHDDDDDLFSNLDIDSFNTNVIPCQSTVVPTQSTHVNQFLDDDDDIFFEANIPDTVAETLQQNQGRLNNIISDDDDSFDMTEIEKDMETEMLDAQNEERRNAINSTVKQTSHMPAVQSVNENIDYFDPDLDEIFRNNYSIPDDPTSISNDITNSNYEFKILGLPLVTILQLHSMDDNDKSERSFVVKCEIERNLDNLQIKSNQYVFVALIKDSSDMQLEVSFSNNIIEKWADTTAEELQKMRAAFRKYPQQKQRAENILKTIGKAAEDLNDFVKIEYSHKNERPEVTEIIENQSIYEEMLSKKLAKRV